MSKITIAVASGKGGTGKTLFSTNLFSILQLHVKNICLVDSDGNLVVAIVKGEDRVSTTRVGKAIGKDKPRTATPEEILERTGYPCGGTPSFGYEAVFLVDERVMEKEWVLSGGGSENSLLRIAPRELLRANGGRVEKIRR